MKKGKKVEDLKWVKPSEVEKYLKEKHLSLTNRVLKVNNIQEKLKILNG